MKMNKYTKIDERAWNDFGKNLLEGKDFAKQKEFLKACKVKREFLNYMKTNLLSKEGAIVGDQQFSVAEFPAFDSELDFFHNQKQKQTWEYFCKISDEEVLTELGFWGYVVIDMLQQGKIQEPHWLAKSYKSPEKNGLYQIDLALREKRKADGCVRRILRSMCNPTWNRGKRVVFCDFPLGKSYWRWHWAHAMASYINLEVTETLDLLDMKNYDVFAVRMHSGKSYISQRNILGGLILFLQEKGQELSGKNLGELIDRVSFLSAWKAIELQPPPANKDELEQIYLAIQ